MRPGFGEYQNAARATDAVRSTRAAFTLIEVVVAMAIFLAGSVSLTLLSARTHTLRQATEEREVVRNAMNSIAQQVRAISLISHGDAAGWSQAMVAAYLPGGVPGANVAVNGLTPIAGAVTVATVQVITDETLTDQQIGVTLGMPRDLDGDGLTTNANVGATALLLPVVVTLQWTGVSGQGSIVQGIYVESY